jgi:hypothetical protein
MDGVSRVAVTEIVLNEAPAVAIVGQDEPAGVSQRADVRPDGRRARVAELEPGLTTERELARLERDGRSPCFIEIIGTIRYQPLRIG